MQSKKKKKSQYSRKKKKNDGRRLDRTAEWQKAGSGHSLNWEYKGISKSSLLKLGGWSSIDSTSWNTKKTRVISEKQRNMKKYLGRGSCCRHSQGTCLAGSPEDAAVALHYSAPAAGLATGATLPPLPAGGTGPLTESRLGSSTGVSARACVGTQIRNRTYHNRCCSGRRAR